MRVVYDWLAELIELREEPERLARDVGLRGFEVASVEGGRHPVIDFEITANRPDCLSHIGFAREVSAIYGRPLRVDPHHEPDGAEHPKGIPDAEAALEVIIEDPELCPRYCAQVFEVNVAASPSWLSDRLEAAGLRPISNIVDVTNYVMLELGQPMHAFDLDRLEDRTLVIRRARPGEKLRTLDGLDRELDAEMLVIADGRSASAIGGVMGGGHSEVGASTTRVALESAYFQPASVRRTSRRLALKTDASTRFERGGDIAAPPGGIARAAALMQRIGAGRPVGGLIDRYPAPREPRRIQLRASRIARLLGVQVPDEDVPRYLTPLGFRLEPKAYEPAGIAQPGWLVSVPTFRVDVTREVDLIEEVGRHYGFDRIPVTFPALRQPQGAPDERIERDRKIRTVLTAAGFSEAMTFAFIEKTAAAPFSPDVEPVELTNPLSEKFAVLRPSLLPGLIDSAAHNRRRGRTDVTLFESGSRFTSDGEHRATAFVWTGANAHPHWSAEARDVDFFDVKGITELLCRALGVAELEFSGGTAPYLVGGRSADVRASGRTLGVIGLVEPALLQSRGFPVGEELYAGELDVDALAHAALRRELRAEPLPKFPTIVRDLSVLVAEALPAAAVRGTIRAAAPSTLESIAEFDRYQGKGVPEGRVSLSLRLTFRSAERTLTDGEVDAAMNTIVEALQRAHGAERR